MPDYQQYFAANKELWNKRTAIHIGSEFYNVPDFLEGKSSLNQIELNELGDVRDKKILHLQCHFGMDSLSLARMGAQVTGVDLSDAAIEQAKKLSEDAGVEARFICCNAFDLREHLDEQFDIVFTTYGVLGWLPDLERWAEIVAHCLKPGGFLYLAEFHPIVWMFDESFKEIKYHYHNEEVIATETQGTYTDREANISNEEYGWNHSLSEVINCLIEQGLNISFLNEYNYSPYNCFNNTVQGSDGYWRIKGMENKIPMVYSLKASSPLSRGGGT